MDPMSKQRGMPGSAAINLPHVEDMEFGAGQVATMDPPGSAESAVSCFCMTRCSSCDTSEKEIVSLWFEISADRSIGYGAAPEIPC